MPSWASPRQSPFRKARTIENRYVRTLRKIAGHVGDIVTAFDSPAIDPETEPEIRAALIRYSEVLAQWAPAVSARVISEVDRQDLTAFRVHARMLGKELRREIFSAPTGQVMREAMARQVGLITSLPTEAAERVHDLVIESRTGSVRAKEIAAEIMRSGDVTKSRATLIARTEIARTGSELTEARAVHAGSEQYIWHTAEDSDVRPDHAILNGKVFYWSAPPIADRRTGARAAPGRIYNCRCWPEPLFPDD